MRRAIAAVVVAGLALGGAVAAPSQAAVRGDVKARVRPAAPASKHRKPATRTVVYQGYEFQAPASWPVYRLDKHPRTCVRYDIHAIYLGTPGPEMLCPAGLVGRTETISFIPVTAASAKSGPSIQGNTEERSVYPQRLATVHAIMTQDVEEHDLQVKLIGSGHSATVFGTYANDPAQVRAVLETLRLAPAGTPPSGQTGTQQQSARPSATRGSLLTESAPAPKTPAKTLVKKPLPTYTSWRGVPSQWPTVIVSPNPSQPAPPPPPVAAHPVGGFDSCTAPTTAIMHDLRGAYAAVGVYIGGANSACAYGNLSTGWVNTVTAAGWGILPTYVGPQAPCWQGHGVLITPGAAAAQGSAAATDAVSRAQQVGFQTGSPIYYDMEGYLSNASCTATVLSFLSAWDQGVTAAGYLTGVYSSEKSGIADLQQATATSMPGFTAPDAIWIAHWDDNPSLHDGTLAWPLSDRSKQYQGNVHLTVKGTTLFVDKDIVGGPVAS